MVVSGSMGEVFAHEHEFPLAIFVVLGDRIKPIVNSSLSSEESGRVLVFSMTVTYRFRAGSGFWTIIGCLVVPGWRSSW